MNAAIYARKSFGENDSRSSIDSQKDAIRRFCESHHIDIVAEYYDDGVRGWETERPGLNMMMEMVRTKNCPFQLIVVFQWDRLFRKYSEASKIIDEIESYGILTASASGGIVTNGNEKLGRTAALFVAEIENIVRGEHILAGQIHWAGLGYTVGGRPPYGYRRAIVEDIKGRIRFRYEIVDSEAEIVKSIYNMRINGMIVSEITKILNEKKIPSPEGKLWRRCTVYKILYSPTRQQKYVGNMLYNTSKNFKARKKAIPKPQDEWVICKNAHPKIITEEMLEKIKSKK